jgi:hypothetical protein
MSRGGGVGSSARKLIALAIALVALAITATSASAATTRAEFVAQADPICQNGQAQEAVAAQPLLRATKRAKKHKNRKTRRRADRALATYFAQYALIERAVNAQIATVPPAPDDVSLVGVWLRARGELIDFEGQLFNGSLGGNGGGLKGFAKFLTLIFEITGRQQEVADVVRDFGFQYCSQNPGGVAIGLGDLSGGP